MKAFFGKTKLEVKLLGVFFCFVLFFTLLRTQVGEVSAWILSFTHDVTLTDSSEEFADERNEFQKKELKKATQDAKKKLAQKKKQESLDRNKPITLNKPKTKSPIVLVTENSPTWDDKNFSEFPPLRKPNAQDWGKEKTIIRATTDGRKLYLLIRLFDANPDKAITKFSQNNSAAAWQDDSVEIFLMEDRKSKVYCQYILAVSGVGHRFYMANSENPYSVANEKQPSDLVDWSYDVTKCDNRFEMEIAIPLSNIGIGKLDPDDSLLIQIVRNYRGQGGKGSVTTQLFPTHIYADKRFGLSNHDRRAFQPVKIINSEVFSTMDKSDDNALKGIN